MTWRSGGYLRLYDRPDGEESAVLSSAKPIITVAPTYVYSRIIYSQKTIFQIIFRALSEGPRDSTPTFSNPSSNDTHVRLFPRLSTAKLNILLRHSQPPTSPLRQRHLRIPLFALPTLGFSRLSTSIYAIFKSGFTQALPASTATPTPMKFKNKLCQDPVKSYQYYSIEQLKNFVIFSFRFG